MQASVIARGALARFGIKPYPLGLTYEVSWLCNLACSYCDRHTPMKKELTREQIFGALDAFHELGMRDVSLDGGEPLAHRCIGEIVDWLAARRITVAMNTNGILVPRRLEVIRKLALVKISLDGPKEQHDAARGEGSFDAAIAGARAAQAIGVPVELTCTLGRHNVDVVDALLAISEPMQIPIVFQPALNSLFNDTDRDGSAWELPGEEIRRVFRRLEVLKQDGRGIGNKWASLRHFRRFPTETRPPCAAGWVFCTMDPEGVLFPCGQLNRADRTNSVVDLGVARAFANLDRRGCGQCWCARLVEENYLWGCRVDKMLPPLARLGVADEGP
jgi:MoaA/NifB/PqqE/SkfB family radical SAM enzyme